MGCCASTTRWRCVSGIVAVIATECDFVEADRLGNGSTPDMVVISLTGTTVQAYCWRAMQR